MPSPRLLRGTGAESPAILTNTSLSFLLAGCSTRLIRSTGAIMRRHSITRCSASCRARNPTIWRSLDRTPPGPKRKRGGTDYRMKRSGDSTRFKKLIRIDPPPPVSLNDHEPRYQVRIFPGFALVHYLQRVINVFVGSNPPKQSGLNAHRSRSLISWPKANFTWANPNRWMPVK